MRAGAFSRLLKNSLFVIPAPAGQPPSKSAIADLAITRSISGKPEIDGFRNDAGFRVQRTGGQAISAVQPGPAAIVNRNPCNLTIAATRLKPRPNPSVRRLLSERKKRLVTASRSISVMPRPVSFTRITVSPSRRSKASSTRPPAGVNFTALSTRLATASNRRSRSPCTVASSAASTQRVIRLSSAIGS